MRLKYEPSSEPLHIFVELLFLNCDCVPTKSSMHVAQEGLHKHQKPPRQNCMNRARPDQSTDPKGLLSMKREFKLAWREVGPPNHQNDKVDSDQYFVNKELSLSLSLIRRVYRGTSLKGNRPPSKGNHMTLGIVLL